jgi:hypothetical protein
MELQQPRQQVLVLIHHHQQQPRQQVPVPIPQQQQQQPRTVPIPMQQPQQGWQAMCHRDLPLPGMLKGPALHSCVMMKLPWQQQQQRGL